MRIYCAHRRFHGFVVIQEADDTLERAKLAHEGVTEALEQAQATHAQSERHAKVTA